MTKPILAVLFTTALAGCNGSPASSIPLSPTPAPPPTQTQGPAQTATVSSISGFATDTAFRPLAGARVAVVDGPHAGSSTTADALGGFTLTGSFGPATTFRASKDGYISATQTWRCSVAVCAGPSGARPWLGFSLAVLAPPVSIAGDYTLTIAAGEACTALAPGLRIRTYAATITPRVSAYSPADTLFDVSITDVPIAFADLYRITLGVAGDHVGFGLYGDHNPFLVERVTPSESLAFSGSAPGVSVGTSPVSTIATSFEGSIEYFAPPAPARCEAKNHRLTLTRRYPGRVTSSR